MPPIHHPSAQALANLLIGDCSPGASLLISRHLDACPQCAIRVQAMGAVGGPSREIRCDPMQELRAGVEIARVQGASGLGEAVLHLRARPGEPLSVREPWQVAEILVLQGALVVDGEAYTPGDFISVEEHAVGAIAADPEQGCACLITCLDSEGVATG